ncbi:MAG: selenium-dependent molybdenum cofactor biosynthesis protein YqeB [Finegoldia magna]|uniref:selenium-dependent molybdenum cofactor biosynthesis protein YqeB n=1 Tax=Finegoldia TaxID=150022 RepID=UPI000B91773F|nr:selenium-dependent molybdenum cofactor biosynthesis protein YqeB [Finegoldia magna]MDU5977242.1 selenium-dependent molybdenum cofactor biosynthesis protein YqeB [Finegoldia magna]OXZ25720.1 molybdenum hydroxylase [Finegoldia magna]
MQKICLIRGAGDIATGTIQKLVRAGFKCVVTEVSNPSSIRRKVSLSEAIYEKKTVVEDIEAVLCENLDEIGQYLERYNPVIIVDPKLTILNKMKFDVVVDAILAKKNTGLKKEMADITIGLGPGFEAGVDCDIVIETMRGHDLARIIKQGFAKKNTGIPGIIDGFSNERVIYSDFDGQFTHIKSISDIVNKEEIIAKVGDNYIRATLDGVIRGMIRDNFEVKKGLKIIDIDPRYEEVENCFTISDKARAIGGAVLEAIMMLENRREKYAK